MAEGASIVHERSKSETVIFIISDKFDYIGNWVQRIRLELFIEWIKGFKNDEGFFVSVGNEDSAEQACYGKIFCAYGVSVIVGNFGREVEFEGAAANRRYAENAVFQFEIGCVSVGKRGIISTTLFAHIGNGYSVVVILKKCVDFRLFAHKVISRFH